LRGEGWGGGKGRSGAWGGVGGKCSRRAALIEVVELTITKLGLKFQGWQKK